MPPIKTNTNNSSNNNSIHCDSGFPVSTTNASVSGSTTDVDVLSPLLMQQEQQQQQQLPQQPQTYSSEQLDRSQQWLTDLETQHHAQLTQHLLLQQKQQAIRQFHQASGLASAVRTTFDNGSLPPALPATTTSSTQQTFVYKLYSIIEDPNNRHHIRWAPQGKSFLVDNPTVFAATVLPIHFKHQNFSSFVRQLNMYGFHKKVSERSRSAAGAESDVIPRYEFEHPQFREGCRDALALIRRKDKNVNDQRHSPVMTPSRAGHHPHSYHPYYNHHISSSSFLRSGGPSPRNLGLITPASTSSISATSALSVPSAAAGPSVTVTSSSLSPPLSAQGMLSPTHVSSFSNDSLATTLFPMMPDSAQSSSLMPHQFPMLPSPNGKNPIDANNNGSTSSSSSGIATSLTSSTSSSSDAHAQLNLMKRQWASMQAELQASRTEVQNMAQSMSLILQTHQGLMTTVQALQNKVAQLERERDVALVSTRPRASSFPSAAPPHHQTLFSQQQQQQQQPQLQLQLQQQHGNPQQQSLQNSTAQMPHASTGPVKSTGSAYWSDYTVGDEEQNDEDDAGATLFDLDGMTEQDDDQDDFFDESEADMNVTLNPDASAHLPYFPDQQIPDHSRNPMTAHSQSKPFCNTSTADLSSHANSPIEDEAFAELFPF